MAGTFEGQVALVVGAGAGIGRAVRDGVRRGGRRRRGGRPPAGAAAGARRRGRRRPRPPHPRRAVRRVRRSSSASGSSTRTVEEFGRVDIVVNVATARRRPVPRSTTSTSTCYRRAFELNVLGVLEISRCAARSMRQTGGGAIIQISTLAATVMQPNMSIYSSTKRAMMVASFTMAKEFGRDNIRVNVVSPGYTTGDDLDAMWAGHRRQDRRGPRGRVGQGGQGRGAAPPRRPRGHRRGGDVPRLAAAPRNITGVEIHVDAGQVIG